MYSLKFLGFTLLLLLPFLSWIDLKIAHFFFQIGNDRVEHFISSPFADFLFDYGPIPAQGLAGLSAIILTLSYFVQSLKKWRKVSLILFLTLVIGSGLITNGLLKEYWGRPRPKQVTEFGGTQTFRPFYKPNFFNQPMPSKSFPSGHSTMGFYFFALAFIGKRLGEKWLTYLGYALVVFLGIGLSLTRMAQGAHFFSDTLFSAIIMWFTAKAMDWLVYSEEYTNETINQIPKTAL